MQTDRQKTERCIKRILFPVVRLCMRLSLHFGDLLEILKEVFVQVAKEELARLGEEESMSRLSAMTGVHRKDVTRLVRSSAPKASNANTLARIMVQWQHGAKFRTASGKPRVLMAEGRDSEFAQLANGVTGGDLSSYALLHEMERLGIVERRGKTVRLIWKDYVSSAGVEEGLNLLALDYSDLSSAVEDNLQPNSEIKNLHLRTEFDKIDPAALPTIKEWLLNEGSAFHARVRQFLSKFDLDINPGCFTTGQPQRVAVGAFSFTPPGNSKFFANP